MKQKSCVIFCRCGAGFFSDNKLDEIAASLRKLNVHLIELHDLCALSLNEKNILKAIGQEFEKKMVIACYPRAVKNIFRQAGIEFGNFDTLNIRELSPEQISGRPDLEFFLSQSQPVRQVYTSALDVPAWFPVIDESLCTHCGRCARFCLFGVYSFNKKSLRVVNPLACKNKCPACGRTCPTSAIIFPRLDEESSLAGAEPQADKKPVAEEGLYVMLNNRNHGRKNIFSQGLLQKAVEERQKALNELQNTLAKNG